MSICKVIKVLCNQCGHVDYFPCPIKKALRSIPKEGWRRLVRTSVPERQFNGDTHCHRCVEKFPDSEYSDEFRWGIQR